MTFPLKKFLLIEMSLPIPASIHIYSSSIFCFLILNKYFKPPIKLYAILLWLWNNVSIPWCSTTLIKYCSLLNIGISVPPCNTYEIVLDGYSPYGIKPIKPDANVKVASSVASICPDSFTNILVGRYVDLAITFIPFLVLLPIMKSEKPNVSNSTFLILM